MVSDRRREARGVSPLAAHPQRKEVQWEKLTAPTDNCSARSACSMLLLRSVLKGYLDSVENGANLEGSIIRYNERRSKEYKGMQMGTWQAWRKTFNLREHVEA